MSRLRRGEWIALIGALVLLTMLPLHWFAGDRHPGQRLDTRGWTALGWPIVVLLVALALLGLLLALTTATRRSPAGPIALSIVTWIFGAIVVCVLVLRLITEPGLDAGLADGQVDLLWPAWVGLVATIAIPVGAASAMGDERTDAPGSQYDPPPARRPPPPLEQAKRNGAGGGSRTEPAS